MCYVRSSSLVFVGEMLWDAIRGAGGGEATAEGVQEEGGTQGIRAWRPPQPWQSHAPLGST